MSKRYIVTEEELEELIAGSMDSVDPYYGSGRRDDALAACRSRPCVFYSDACDFDGKLLGSLWASAKEEIPE